ncbi:unnamed protein product [Protopolystoma xenopodis]|uniref:Uncharacterized protein n=1 Tax=Protopolystoma xenopodis TaxID=117903 RepID=A0A448WIR1_9PLAT|nr:unnamed protein product [Protopolystoma xenopodis]
MARLIDDADYDVGETSADILNPGSDAGNPPKSTRFVKVKTSVTISDTDSSSKLSSKGSNQPVITVRAHTTNTAKSGIPADGYIPNVLKISTELNKPHLADENMEETETQSATLQESEEDQQENAKEFQEVSEETKQQLQRTQSEAALMYGNMAMTKDCITVLSLQKTPALGGKIEEKKPVKLDITWAIMPEYEEENDEKMQVRVVSMSEKESMMLNLSQIPC